jgi:RHH-type proline utilization regulon transcriptional repressor/proline dehydrogenase/delta 1-pyrroline-5-carboxylate dehydrogenase
MTDQFAPSDLTGPAAITAHYTIPEAQLVARLLQTVGMDRPMRGVVQREATQLVTTIRDADDARTAIDDLLQEYGLSTDEGVMLMRLSEALIRTPDFATSRKLIRDKIGEADWRSHAGQSGSFLVNQATTGLRVTAAWIAATGGTQGKNLIAKLGDRVLDGAMAKAMAVMGNHFVLGRDIAEACKRARANEARGIAHSYDMLGEAAYTDADADRYFAAYMRAIEHLAGNATLPSAPLRRPGLSVKLSALHPRYEYNKRETCVPVLVDRVAQLARVAAHAGLWLNIDAEEADRLELSLLVFEPLLRDPMLADWDGLGLVVQAYQRRAGPVLDHVAALAKSAGRKIAVRLVKGAYWDMEIKRAQELGLTDYPVFTRKENTDLSYLACARQLLDHSDWIFPQIATHNAHTAVSVAHLADGRAFEFQRLHGMGAALHDALVDTYGAQSRVYAPVGTHKDLLPYLVRRLLENGANGSFVNQMMDEDTPPSVVAADPISIVEANAQAAHPKILAPCLTVEAGRRSAAGLDLTQSDVARSLTSLNVPNHQFEASSLIDGVPVGGAAEPVFSPQARGRRVGAVAALDPEQIDKAVLVAGASSWATETSPQARGEIFDRAADLLEAERDMFLQLCVREAGKTYLDAIAEVREAVDFCRYYARQAQAPKIAGRAPLGIVACISPWNFPLAIFLGQVVAALSVGNTVIAKPAAQTPIIAFEAVKLLHRAGVPAHALHLVLGDGAALGNALTRHPLVGGLCFTGSTRTAKIIARNLAETGRGDVPLIAEIGGINAMIVDSSALLEQAVQDVVESAFQSAGQRCSACRIVCVQSDIADDFIAMLTGAMRTLKLGDPSDLETDVGPVIDAPARQSIQAYKVDAALSHCVHHEVVPDAALADGHFVGPILIETASVADVEREVFGPVLHLVRYEATGLAALVEQINALGFGLTMGLHTRVDDRVEEIASRAHVGNLYVNRNQIGAVVGVHPFGGEGLSGTGPKAGGPHYLFGLTRSPGAPRVDAGPETAVMMGAAAPVAEDAARVDAARASALAWHRSVPATDRAAQLHQWLGEGAGDHGADWAYESQIALPGPTGEDNVLRLHAKGVFVCFGGDQPDTVRDQIAKCLAAGSAAIAVLPGGTCPAKLEADWSDAPQDLVQWIELETGRRLINANIDGVVADGHMRTVAAGPTCLRTGPILPILSARDPIERFLHERTLTINTTAAGGNASLLAMA